MSFVRAMLMLCSRYSSPNLRCSANSRCSSCPFHHAIQCTPQSRSMDPRSIRYTPARGTAGSLRASKHSVHSLPSDPIVQWPPSTDQCLAALDRSRSQVARAPATRTIKTAHSVTQSFDRSPIDRSCQWRLYIHDSTLVRTAPLASWVPWPERRHHQQQHEHTLTRAHAATLTAHAPRSVSACGTAPAPSCSCVARPQTRHRPSPANEPTVSRARDSTATHCPASVE